MEQVDVMTRMKEMRDPLLMWDRRMSLWRDPDDCMQALLSRILILHPFADLKTLVSSIQTKGSPSSTEGEFQVLVDVLQFKVNEVAVRIDENGTITVEAKHEEREDEHGFISRYFKRVFVLPDIYDVNHVFSKLSFDGVLTITAPLKEGFKLKRKRSGKRLKKRSGKTSGEHSKKHSEEQPRDHSGKASEKPAGHSGERAGKRSRESSVEYSSEQPSGERPDKEEEALEKHFKDTGDKQKKEG